MNELLRLLQLLAPGFSSFTDEELQTHLDGLQAAAQAAAADPNALSDEDLARIREAATVAGAIRADQVARFDAAEARRTEIAAALALINDANTDPAPADPATPPVDGDPATPPADPATPPADPAPADPPPADPAPADPANATPPAPAAPAPVPATVAATPPASPSRPMIRASARRATPPAVPVSLTASSDLISGDVSTWGLTASAGHPTLAEGDTLMTNRQLADSFISAWNQTRGGHSGPNQYIPVVTRQADMRTLYGPDRFLDRDPVNNARKLQIMDPWEIARRRSMVEAGTLQMEGGLMASGGICAPIPPSYDLPVVGTDARDFRDRMMTRFGAETRGGIRTMSIPVLEEVTGAIGFWTEENDRTPNAGAVVADRLATKPCLTIGCGDEDEDLVYAITRCFKTGNFRAKYFPEQVAAYMRLILVSNARQAEQRLMTKVESDSTVKTYGAPATTLGTIPTVLAALDLMAPSIQQPDRYPTGVPLLFGAPFWLRNQMRTDQARRLPFGTTDENYALSDAKIDNMFTMRGYSPVWLIDGLSGQQFARPADGALDPYPTTAVCYSWPAGTWMFLDGGELNLGMVRDSTLNSTNDVEFWAETFEGAHRHGLHSTKLTLTVSATGEVSGTTDIT